MPPKNKPQPTADEIGNIIGQLDERIRQGRAARIAKRPPVAHYRLSRKAYQNTVYDLLGVRFRPDSWPKYQIPREEYLFQQ